MPKFLIARAVVIILCLVIFYMGTVAVRTGEIRSRGYKFQRDENPAGYWFTLLVTLAGPPAIIYLMLTR